MMVTFKRGDRVRYIKRGGNIKYGEIGTVKFVRLSDPCIAVEWSNSYPWMYAVGEDCRPFCGWHVGADEIAHAQAVPTHTIIDGVRYRLVEDGAEEEREEAQTYSVGNVFKVEKRLYLLALIDAGEAKFISLSDGNRWSDKTINRSRFEPVPRKEIQDNLHGEFEFYAESPEAAFRKHFAEEAGK